MKTEFLEKLKFYQETEIIWSKKTNTYKWNVNGEANGESNAQHHHNSWYGRQFDIH